MVAIALLMTATGLLGLGAALLITPGLPYDEPAHWSNVLYVAEYGTLPVLGEPGVTYEGQQAPLYYLGAALLAGAIGDSGFMAVRLLGVVGHVLLTGLTAVILHSIARDRALVVAAGTAFVALNPMLIVMSATVQNDTWALVWGFLAIAVAVRRFTTTRWVQGVVVGAAASLAILTKVSMAPLLLGLVIAYLFRRRFIEPLAALTVTALLTGWWFVRNLILYGDLTGQSAVARTGAIFEGVATSPFDVARTVLTYLTLPTEYVRNTISAPVWVDATALVVGSAIIVGVALIALRERRRYGQWGLLAVVSVAVVSICAWLVQVVFGWPVAFRTAYSSLPFIALAVGSATQVFRSRWAQIVIMITISLMQLLAGVWVAASLIALDHAPMLF